MNKHRASGFGLWELLLVLLLLALLSGTLLLRLQESVARQQVMSQLQRLGQTVRFAQAEGQRLAQPLWLCPVQLRVDGRINGCVRQLSEAMWAQGVLVYADRPGQRSGVYDGGEVVRTALLDERRYRLRLRVWRQQPDRFMLLPWPDRAPQVAYGAQGWGATEPVWLQLQLALQTDPQRCTTLLVPPSGPLQRCDDGMAQEGMGREALCVCF